MKKITWLWAPMICAALLFSGCSEERTTSPRGTGLELTAEEQAHSIAIRATPINGNSNGSNGNDNGTNGNDNGTNGNDNGTNGNDNGTNGNDNGTNGNDNGTNGNDNGTNGNDNGTNGNDNGTNGNDNGTNGNDNGTNGNDNGTNGNDNGTNGNDNGTNGNDNGTNGNDNGTNGNDNGTNGNDNGSGGNCSDGSTQLETQMTGDEDNEARYRRWSDNCREFRVRVRELNPYTNYNVIVDGVTVGTLRTDDDGRGELRYENTGFPQNFPHPGVGSQVSVGPVWGTFWSDCSSNSNCNG